MGMKSTTPQVFSLVLLLGFGASVQAQFSVVANGGALTITSYSGPGGNLVIPNAINGLPVTSIGQYAFCQGCGGKGWINSVTIPDSVTNIGDAGFIDCFFLTNVNLGNGVTNIGNWVFSGCERLLAFEVGPFNQAYSSTNGILFDKNQMTLVRYTTGVPGAYTIPDTVKTIGREAFLNSFALTELTIPNGVVTIGDLGLDGCKVLRNLTIPDTVTSIGSASFRYCTGMTNIALGSNVASIGSEALNTCSSLINVTIPGSVTNIGARAFGLSSNLAGVFFKGNAPALGQDQYGGTAFEGDPSATVYYLPATKGWGATFGGAPSKLWNPQALTTDASFGVQQNRFGFNIAGTPDIPLVIEACTNLSSRSWVPLQSSTLTNGAVYVSDPQWTSFPDRFYRIRSP